MSEIEFFNNDSQQPAGPKISESGLSYYRSLLGNEAWVRENPQQAALVRASVDSALALTGQSLEPPADTRSLAQQAHDRLYGVSYDANGAPKLPAELASVIQRDVSSRAPDPRAIAAQLKSVGRDPDKALADAQALLDRIGSPLKAEALSAGAVVQLGVYAEHLRKHAAGSPQ